MIWVFCGFGSKVKRPSKLLLGVLHRNPKLFNPGNTLKPTRPYLIAPSKSPVKPDILIGNPPGNRARISRTTTKEGRPGLHAKVFGWIQAVESFEADFEGRMIGAYRESSVFDGIGEWGTVRLFEISRQTRTEKKKNRPSKSSESQPRHPEP